MKIIGLLALFFVLSIFPHRALSEGAASPSADELLDFDSANKSGKSAPTSNVVAPAPAVAPAPIVTAPTQGAPVQAPGANQAVQNPAPAAPPAAAPPSTTSALPSLPTSPDQDATAADKTALPPPASAPAPTGNVNPQDSEALDGPPPAVVPPVTKAPPPPPAAITPPPTTAAPTEIDLAPPPPEIVNDNPPAKPSVEAPAPAPTESFPSATTAEAPPPTTDANDVTDSDRRNEARFARIYQKYNQNELGDEKWGQIAGDKSSENYSIQGGDNLWDVSTKFFGNGYYWPKVWQLNETITNPHMVRVGNSIKFSPGSTTVAPSLSVEQTNITNEQTNITNETNVQTLSFEDMPDPAPEVEEIPTAEAPTGNTILIPPPRKRRPVLAKIPDSFPDWRDASSHYDSSGFSMEVFKPITEHRTPSAIPSIISEEPWEANGEIVEMEGETTVASTFQYVIVQLDIAAKKGDFFTIFSNSGKVSDPTSLLPSTVGYEIDTRAEMRIEDLIQGTTDTYRAMIVYTTMPVRLGDVVRAGRLISRVFYDKEGSPSNVAAKIVNGEYNHREVFAIHNIVYLDRGSQDGLQVGSLLNVIKNTKLRNPNSIIKFDPKPIGLLKVVALDSHVATATIISEYDAIVPGDETAVPQENELSGDEKKEMLLRTAPPPGGAGAVPEGDQNSDIAPPEPN